MVFDTVFSGGPILGSVNEFIDYAQIVVMVLIVYYIIRFFTIGGGTPEREGSDFMDWAREKGEERKRKGEEAKEKEKKKKEVAVCRGLLNPAKGFIIRAEQKIENVDDESRVHSGTALHRITTGINQIENNLRSAKRALRASRIKEKAERRDYITRLEAYVESLQHLLDTTTKPHIPTSAVDTSWNAKVIAIRNSLDRIKFGCGYLITSMDKFMDDCTIQDPTHLPVIVPLPAPTPSP